MAYENLNISSSLFCLGPQVGTFCYIITDETRSRLILINSSGGFIKEFILSSKIFGTLVSLEYTGPKSLSRLYKGLPFFTLERETIGGISQAIIKRWELDPVFNTLDLKQTFYKDLKPYGMAVEHYNLSLSENCPGKVFYVEVNNPQRIEPGMEIFLGPSTDADNPHAVESAAVSYVSGNKVYFTSRIGYQYVAGDKLSFTKNFYILSKESEILGSLTRIRSRDGAVVESESNKPYYAEVRAVRWSQAIEGIALVYLGNVIFKRPYDYYLNWRSMNLNNELGGSYSEVYDIVFDNTDVFKLMRSAIYRDDSGFRSRYNWSTYNYQLDTLVPYTNSLQVYTRKSYLGGNQDSTILYVRARDQFGISLRDVNVNFYIGGGDLSAVFDPLNGQVITDENGEAVVRYISSGGYHGMSLLKVRADKGSAYTGSQYIWDQIRIHTNLSVSNKVRNYGISNTKSGFGKTKAISNIFKTLQFDRPTNNTGLFVPAIYLNLRTFFTTPRSNSPSGPSSSPSNPMPAALWFNTYVENYSQEHWPQLQVAGGRLDGPPVAAEWPEGYKAEDIDFDGVIDKIPSGWPFIRAHYIRQVAATRAKGPTINQLSDFLIYRQPDQEGFPPFVYVGQNDIIFEMFFSQLKLSRHSYFVDGLHSVDLYTRVKLNQFIFVEDAVPKFWSEKNYINTFIWIRLRPFAFSLVNNTFRFWIREVWSEGEQTFDTGYYEVTQLGTISNFDAGGNLFGIEFLYQPLQPFHYDALVFVHLEVYDGAGEPNFIYLDYWFRCIPDYHGPYLVNLSPGREQDFVPVDTDVYFEIKDDGAGVDINTLEAFINSRTLIPTEIVEISKKHYTVRCNLPKNLLYGKTYAIGVVVADLSPQRNYLRDSYRFYTRESDGPYFVDLDPRLCLRGMPRFYDVAFTILANEMGVDKDSIRVQVGHRDTTKDSSIVPIIYRIS